MSEIESILAKLPKMVLEEIEAYDSAKAKDAVLARYGHHKSP